LFILADGQGLNGTIPEEIGHLSLLETFVLKNNDLLGGTIRQLVLASLQTYINWVFIRVTCWAPSRVNDLSQQI